MITTAIQFRKISANVVDSDMPSVSWTKSVMIGILENT